MKNKHKQISALFFITQLILANFLAFASIKTATAADAAPPAKEDKSEDSTSFSVGKFLTVGEKQEQSYLQSNNPVASFIIQIINFLILTIGSFSFLTVIIGGFTLVTSHGNENQITKGKDILKYAITGLIVALASYFITAFVQSLFYELPISR